MKFYPIAIALCNKVFLIRSMKLLAKSIAEATADKSLTSIRDLFKRLNNTGYESDISTFSKANLHISQKPFVQIYQQINQIINRQKQKKFSELHDLSNRFNNHYLLSFC